MKKIAPLPSLSCHEHGSFEGGGLGVFIGEDQRHRLAPVRFNEPVQNVAHRHRVIGPTGAFAVGTRRHQVVAGPGANASCHDPVPNALCWARHMSRVPAATIAGIFGLDLWLVI